MKLYFDLHTHTIMSGHAYSTLTENVDCAIEAGMLAYGFSEHAPAMPGTVKEFYFENLKVLPETIHGIQLFGGIELNIMDYQGNVDCTQRLLSKVHYAIASLHPPCIKPGTKEENTSAILGAMENPLINIIGHPDDSRFPLDYDAVVQKAVATGTVLELNNSSLSVKSTRVNAVENVKEMLGYCREYGARIIVGTDSHICYDVGRFDRAIALLESVDFPEDLIVNASIDGLRHVLQQK